MSRYGSKNSHLLKEPKIIYPRINNQSNFFIDTKGEYSLSDNNFFISSGNIELLGLLNSSLTFFFLKNISSTLQGGYYDFRRPYIEKIPIKTNINANDLFLDSSIKNIDLYKSNLMLLAELQTQINQTDKEIDALVYELYGLTEEEIAIVENS